MEALEEIDNFITDPQLSDDTFGCTLTLITLVGIIG